MLFIHEICGRCGEYVQKHLQEYHNCIAEIQNSNLTSLNQQVGGDHYKHFKIKPTVFLHKNNIGFMEGNIIKYVCRYKLKGGIQDLLKAKHYIEMLIEMESENVDNG